MVYIPSTWTDPLTYPLGQATAAKLTNIENGISAAINNAPTNSGPNTITAASASNTPGLTVNQNDTTNNPIGVDIQNTGTGFGLRVNSSNSGTGAQGASITSANGGGSASAHALTANLTGSGNANASAANFTSANSSASAVQVSGVETGRGSIKVTHSNPGSGVSADANASALSIDLQWGSQSGTASQGIFIDSTSGGTTGKLLNVRNNGNTIFSITPKSTDFTTGLEQHNTQGRFTDGIAHKTNAGVVSDGTFTNGATDGLEAIDTTNFNVARRVGGNWYTVPVAGSPSAQPNDQGFVTWTADPGIRVGATAPTAGVLNLNKVWVRYPVTVSTFYISISTAGSGATSLANCFVGLYNSSGTQVGFSSDQSTNWQSTGIKSIALTQTGTGTLNLSAGFYWLVQLVGTQSTTNVQFSHTGTLASFVNANLSASTFRTGTNGSALSALPGSFTPSSNTTTNFTAYYWGALS